MSESGENLYYQSFHDDGAHCTNGYDALCTHMKESIESTRNLVRYIEYKLAYEEESYKQIKRIHEKVKKIDNSLPLIKVVTDAFTSESEMVLTSIADFKTSSIEPFKEKIKEASNSFDSLKSDSKFELKKRLNAHDEAVRACKSYGLKFRESFIFKKKITTVDQNEKMRAKIYKIDAAVSAAEKTATVSIEVLKKSLADWKKCFTDLTTKCLEIDTVLLAEAKNFVVAFQTFCSKTNNESNAIYSRVVEFDSNVDGETFYKNIAKEKGTHKPFLMFASINQTGFDDKTEFTLTFCESDVPVLKKPEGTDAIELSKQRVSNSNFYNPKQSNTEKTQPQIEQPSQMLPLKEEEKQAQPNLDKNSKLVGTFCVAKFDYVKSNDDELEFKKGTVIEITGVEDEDWLVGKIGSSVGAFPLKFTEPVSRPSK